MFIHQEFNPSELSLTLSAGLRDVTSDPKFSKSTIKPIPTEILTPELEFTFVND